MSVDGSAAARRDARVIVVGGGVAGVSAAIELAERGVAVTLLEQSASLGGKVRGWRDEAAGSLEHGLHGWWLEYTNFRDLLKRTHLSGNLAELVGPFTVIHRGGAVDPFAFSEWPSPFHVIGMLGRIRSIGLRAKLSSLRAGLAAASFDPDADYGELDGVDFYSWLRRAGVCAGAIRAIFEPTLRSNLFLPLEQISAAAALNAILRGFRRHDSWRFSWLRGNTGDYLWEPLRAHLLDRGAEIRLETRVTGLQLVNGEVAAVEVSSGGVQSRMRCDALILAVDIEACKQLVRASLNTFPFFVEILSLSATDVLVTRVWFHGDVRLPFRDGMLVGFRAVDAFVDIGRFQPELASPGVTVIETQSYLGKTWMQAPEDVVRDLVLADLREALPVLADAYAARVIVLRHPDLFTAFRVGFETHRPTVCTPVPNLFLAADWVRASQPVMFMENAVVTSRHAASAVLKRLGKPPVPILDAPQPDWPVRVLAHVGGLIRRSRAAWRALSHYEPITVARPR